MKMRLTDEIKILNDNTKVNQAQYKLDREAAIISALSSKELDKYEYLTGEDLGYKPGVVEKFKFEYSPLGGALNNKAKSKTDKRDKAVNKDTQNKNLFYNSYHSSVKLKDISDLKELSLDSMHKKLSDFHKKITRLKKITPEIKENKDLEVKVLSNVGDLFNELYCIYKERYEEEKDTLNKNVIKKFGHTKSRFTDYLSESEEEQSDKKSDKKEPCKKAEISDVREFNNLITKGEIGINKELFRKHLSFQRSSEILKTVYNKNDKKKNNKLVSVIKSGLSDLKDESEKTSEDEKRIEQSDKIVDIVEMIVEFNKQNQVGQGLKILTPDQLLSRLPISLAQLKEGSNSEKLKNEIRQLLHSLNR